MNQTLKSMETLFQAASGENLSNNYYTRPKAMPDADDKTRVENGGGNGLAFLWWRRCLFGFILQMTSRKMTVNILRDGHRGTTLG